MYLVDILVLSTSAKAGVRVKRRSVGPTGRLMDSRSGTEIGNLPLLLRVQLLYHLLAKDSEKQQSEQKFTIAEVLAPIRYVMYFAKLKIEKKKKKIDNDNPNLHSNQLVVGCQ